MDRGVSFSLYSEFPNGINSRFQISNTHLGRRGPHGGGLRQDGKRVLVRLDLISQKRFDLDQRYDQEQEGSSSPVGKVGSGITKGQASVYLHALHAPTEKCIISLYISTIYTIYTYVCISDAGFFKRRFSPVMPPSAHAYLYTHSTVAVG